MVTGELLLDLVVNTREIAAMKCKWPNHKVRQSMRQILDERRKRKDRTRRVIYVYLKTSIKLIVVLLDWW